jgi:cellulose biosynthesis protein BcsQ
MGRKVVINDLDPQRGVWDFAEALGRPDGRILKHLAVVDPHGSSPFVADYVLVDTPPALDVSLPAMNAPDWLIIPVIPDHQPVVQLAKFLEALAETRYERPFTRVLGVVPVNVRRWPEQQTMLGHIQQISPSMTSGSSIPYRTRGRSCATPLLAAYGVRSPQR